MPLYQSILYQRGASRAGGARPGVREPRTGAARAREAALLQTRSSHQAGKPYLVPMATLRVSKVGFVSRFLLKPVASQAAGARHGSRDRALEPYAPAQPDRGPANTVRTRDGCTRSTRCGLQLYISSMPCHQPGAAAAVPALCCILVGTCLSRESRVCFLLSSPRTAQLP